jgi:hypothetical protein
MNEQHFEGMLVDETKSKVCLVFDPKDGRVVHVHTVTFLDAQRRIEPAEMEAEARRHAEHFGHAAGRLKILHVPPAAMRGRAAVKVNAAGDGVIPLHPATT